MTLEELSQLSLLLEVQEQFPYKETSQSIEVEYHTKLQ